MDFSTLLIGFLDDFQKLKKKQNLGLTAKQKFLLQLVVERDSQRSIDQGSLDGDVLEADGPGGGIVDAGAIELVADRTGREAHSRDEGNYDKDEIYYYGIKACESDTTKEDTLFIADNTYGDLNRIIVYPRKVSGANNG